MTTENAPRRWSDGGARTTEELKAAALFGSARAVAPLSPESLARIEYGVTARMASAAGRALWTKVGVGVVVAALGTAAVVVGTRRGEPAPAPVPLAVPAPAPVAPVDTAAAPDEPAVAAPGPKAVRAKAPPQHPPDALAEEAALVERAFRSLRTNPGVALAALNEHQRRFPKGQLVAEARRARLDALIALGRHDQAAKLAAALREGAPALRVTELTLVEGEQLMAMGRHDEALSRFERVIAEDASAALGASLGERAWFGRANCRRALGDAFGAKLDARQYLERFPTGAHANELRRWAE